MVSLTENEAKVMEFLVRNFSRNYNINQLSRELGLSPGGTFKILKKLENSDLLRSEKIGNNMLYKINFDSEQALDACKFALSDNPVNPYAKVWIKDLRILRKLTDAAILFGSVLTKGREANDIDVLLVTNQKNLKEAEEELDKINRIKSKKVHSVYQTKEDLVKNIGKKDKAVLEEIRTGIILWGKEVLLEAIKNGQG